MAFLLLLCLLSVIEEGISSGGSCRAAGLCCEGRDRACSVQAPLYSREGEVVGMSRPCFCDHACARVGDCCHDFQQVCGAIDCAVSSWGEWSACSADCNHGAMSRERRVIRDPHNGGATCPELLQKRSCFGSKCDAKPHTKAHRETAMILPATLSSIRQLNASHDIRNNLRLRYRKEHKKQYCVVFEVSKGGCEGVLSKGSTVCVRCERAAMRAHLGFRCHGDGAARFAYLARPHCHGKWKKQEDGEECKEDHCDASFIFV